MICNDLRLNIAHEQGHDRWKECKWNITVVGTEYIWANPENSPASVFSEVDSDPIPGNILNLKMA